MPKPLMLQRAAKTAVFAVGHLTPIQPGLVVLLYHRVGAGDRNIDLSVAMFRTQMQYLRRHCDVVDLQTGINRTQGPTMDRDAVVVTFDDGTVDLFDHAFPVLEELAVPATLYLSTGPVEEGLPFPTWAVGPSQDVPALAWQQVEEMVRSGVFTIGSHTHSHADLDRADKADVDLELRRSKELIEQRLGVPCTDFAYPHAVTSPLAEQAVRAQFSTAAIGGWRKNLPGRLDPYRITRIPVTRADGPAFFRAKVNGRMAAEALLYRLGGTRRS